MIQTLLFAADMGIHTHYLLHYVNSLAAHYDAKVIVVHAVEPRAQLGTALVASRFTDSLQDDSRQDRLGGIIAGVKHRFVDLLEDEYIDGQRGLSRIVDVKVLAGKPVETILQEASNSSADLIVLGSHGQDTIRDNRLGAVSYEILQLSRVPVFMVPMMRNSPAASKAC